MDPVLEQEQKHLGQTYAKLVAIEAKATEALEASLNQARIDRADMFGSLGLDLDGEVDIETFVELTSLYDVIDSYNITNDALIARRDDARHLLEQPYFAKVTLLYPHEDEPRDLYIGSVGMTDEDKRHFVIDWRSPVAEVYYNQSNGPTSYVADSRTISVDLKLRRQFDIERDRLKAYFDTTVAIQDPLLLKSLAKTHSSQLSDITSTIQKEQNAIIRHEDVPALLVTAF